MEAGVGRELDSPRQKGLHAQGPQEHRPTRGLCLTSTLGQIQAESAEALLEKCVPGKDNRYIEVAVVIPDATGGCGHGAESGTIMRRWLLIEFYSQS